MNKIQSAVITPVLAAGSTASPYYYQINITQRLCYPACADELPVFDPQFQLVGVTLVNTNQYVATIRVQGIISYVKCNGGCGCTMQQPLVQEFQIPIASTTAPAVTITKGTTINAITATACQSCSRVLASDTPLTITIA